MHTFLTTPTSRDKERDGCTGNPLAVFSAFMAICLAVSLGGTALALAEYFGYVNSTLTMHPLAAWIGSSCIIALLVIAAFSAVRNLGNALRESRQELLMCKESERKASAIIEQAPDGVLVADTTGKIIEINHSCSKIVGYSREEIKRLSIQDLLTEESLDDGKSHFRETMDTGAATAEIWHKTKDGLRRCLTVDAVKLSDTRVVGFLKDITDVKKAQEENLRQQQQLVQADKMVSLGILISGIAHEINNPTNFITLNTPLLRRTWENILPVLDRYIREIGDFPVGGMSYSHLAPNILPLIDGIANGAKRIQHIVYDLKEYARYDSIKEYKECDLNQVVRSAISLVNHLLKKKTDALRTDLSPGPLFFKGSHQRLEQVIINLLQNAADALTSKGQGIAIKTLPLPEKARISVIVSDEGMGIAPQDLPRITDPFFTTKKESGGTGLGLSVSAGIVKDHGGAMTFESTPGKGTTVTVDLPISQATPLNNGFSP